MLESKVCAKSVEQRKQVHGTTSFVTNGNKNEYQVCFAFITHLENQEYEAIMLCIDAHL